MRRTRGDEHSNPSKIAADSICNAERDGLGLRHASHRNVATRERPDDGPDERHAAITKRLHVRARRGLIPHARVHRGRHHDGTVRCEHHGCREIVGEPVRDARHEVRGGRRDDYRARAASQLDVEFTRERWIPEFRAGGAPRDARERDAADESLRCRREHRFDVRAHAHQLARDDRALVRTDPARHDENDLAPRETSRDGGLGHRRAPGVPAR